MLFEYQGEGGALCHHSHLGTASALRQERSALLRASPLDFEQHRGTRNRAVVLGAVVFVISHSPLYMCVCVYILYIYIYIYISIDNTYVILIIFLFADNVLIYSMLFETLEHVVRIPGRGRRIVPPIALRYLGYRQRAPPGALFSAPAL